MKNILFKAKQLGDGKWVEGYLVKISEDDYRIATEEDIEWSWTEHCDYDGVMTRVNPETICQYTGLTDKNGDKIWENDIVRCCAIDIAGRDCEFVSEVFWSDCAWMLHEEEFSDSMLNYFDMSKEWCSHVPEIEVIGNIFDNPELLENE